MCSSDSVRRRGYSGNSGSASRKDAWASANRVPCGVRISLLGRPDDRNHPHPLSLIRHGDELLPVPTPLHDRRYPIERPPDKPESLMAVTSDRNLTHEGIVGSGRAGRIRRGDKGWLIA